MALDNGGLNGGGRRPSALAAMESQESHAIREPCRLPDIGSKLLEQTSLAHPSSLPRAARMLRPGNDGASTLEIYIRSRAMRYVLITMPQSPAASLRKNMLTVLPPCVPAS